MVYKLTPHLEAEKLRSFIESEEKNKAQWASKWGWILDEYRDLHQDLLSVSQKCPSQMLIVRHDERIKNLRFPATHNQMYGRLASKKEFLLDKYGADYLKPPKIWPDISFNN